jgi:glycerophosphoryl diester phosphodiesterase
MTPKIYAHRGASGSAPENTLAAFELALEQGADGIELDVTLSNDGQIVVIHDDTVDRTTTGKGSVRDLTLAELQSFDAGQGQHIPTLEEVLKALGGKLLINIELKGTMNIYNPLPAKTAKLVNDYGLIGSVLISSFNPFYLKRFHKYCPAARIALLTLPKMARNFIWRFFSYDALHPFYKDVDQALVEQLHNSQKEINVWTADDPEEIKRLAAFHVDGIITNYPMRTREILEAAL